MDVALKEKARQLYMALGSDVSAPNSEPPTPTFIDATSLEVEEIKINPSCVTCKSTVDDV
jgi:hypothetical protein